MAYYKERLTIKHPCECCPRVTNDVVIKAVYHKDNLLYSGKGICEYCSRQIYEEFIKSLR